MLSGLLSLFIPLTEPFDIGSITLLGTSYTTGERQLELGAFHCVLGRSCKLLLEGCPVHVAKNSRQCSALKEFWTCLAKSLLFEEVCNNTTGEAHSCPPVCSQNFSFCCSLQTYVAVRVVLFPVSHPHPKGVPSLCILGRTYSCGTLVRVTFMQELVCEIHHT